MTSKACSATVRSGRLDKARQFLDAADMIDALVESDADLVDAFVTLCVHAGIAAADVISCVRLGVHFQGPDHAGAIALLDRIDTKLGRDLSVLLGLKTKSGYGAVVSSTANRKAAGRAARRLVAEARSIG